MFLVNSRGSVSGTSLRTPKRNAMSLEAQKAAFQLLGLPMTANEDSIRSAWRQLARTYHPALAKDDPEAANKRLAEINAAFDLLSAGQVEARRAARAAEEAAKAAKRAAEKRKVRVAAQRRAAARAAKAKADADAKAEAEAEAAKRATRTAEAETPEPAYRAETAPGTAVVSLPVTRYPERRGNIRARRAFEAALRCRKADAVKRSGPGLRRDE